jgi:hypothetical protein
MSLMTAATTPAHLTNEALHRNYASHPRPFQLHSVLHIRHHPAVAGGLQNSKEGVTPRAYLLKETDPVCDVLQATLSTKPKWEIKR